MNIDNFFNKTTIYIFNIVEFAFDRITQKLIFFIWYFGTFVSLIINNKNILLFVIKIKFLYKCIQYKDDIRSKLNLFV